MEKLFLLFDLAAEFVFRWKDKTISGGKKVAVFFKDAVFDKSLILIGAKDDADGGVIPGNLLQVFEDSYVHIELADILVR